MLMFKKIVAGIVMALAVLAIILSIVSLFGSWVVRARAETVGTQLLLSAEQVIGVTRGGLGRAGGLLDRSGQVVDDVNSRLEGIGTQVAENTRLVDSALDLVGADLQPLISSVITTFDDVLANVIAINDAADAVAAIPLLGITNNRTAEINRLRQLEERMLALQENVVALREELQRRKAELIEGELGGIVQRGRSLGETIITTQEELRRTDQLLAETAVSLVGLRERLPRLLTLITVLFNLVLLLSILAFASLLLHAWAYFKCTEDGLQALLPGDCEQSSATA
jgi:hypothetical protein